MTQVSNDLEGKVALVTGGARGIGKAIALRLARSGAAVAIIDLLDEGEETAELLRHEGVRSCYVKADISSETAVQAAVSEIEETLGLIDILVNNAGITRDRLLVRMEESDWDAVLAVNLKGTFLVTRSVVRGMAKRRSGSIINLSSIVGRRGNAGQTNYSAAKAGLIGFTKSLAREMAPRNVRVNAVAPGFIQTDMTAVLSEEIRALTIGQIPMGRIGSAEEVAEAVAFLAGGSASFITGAVLPVDGGMGT